MHESSTHECFLGITICPLDEIVTISIVAFIVRHILFVRYKLFGLNLFDYNYKYLAPLIHEQNIDRNNEQNEQKRTLDA